MLSVEFYPLYWVPWRPRAYSAFLHGFGYHYTIIKWRSGKPKMSQSNKILQPKISISIYIFPHVSNNNSDILYLNIFFEIVTWTFLKCCKSYLNFIIQACHCKYNLNYLYFCKQKIIVSVNVCTENLLYMIMILQWLSIYTSMNHSLLQISNKVLALQLFRHPVWH